MLFCSHITLHLTQLNISFAHLALMGSCQSQLTIIHVATLDWLCTNWGELEILVLATWGLAARCASFHPFLEHFCSTNRGQLSVSEAFGVHLAASNWLFVSWLKKLINPLSVFRHISCSFFLDPPPHP